MFYWTLIWSNCVQYSDHSVSIKACAGMNGMKLGGEVLTVVQAMPDASSPLVTSSSSDPYCLTLVLWYDPWFLWSITTFLHKIKILQENAGELSYGIPEHAKPLLRKPTSVLEIKNVVQNLLLRFYEVIIFSFNFSGFFPFPVF